MARDRRSGILLHPTSLPGDWGVGDLGPAAVEFLDWLREAGQTVWQLLPMGPVGPGNSPYSGTSAFAVNPLMVSPDRLREEGLLPATALDVCPEFPAGRVDFPVAAEWKEALLRIAWQHARRAEEHRDLVQEALELPNSPRHASWLGDWTLYSALRRRFGNRPWQEWPETYRRREPTTLEVARRELAEETHFHSFCQLLCLRQWAKVRAEARARNIRIVGDMPIYVGVDSADTWAHQELFDLGPDGHPRAVAGVPPDDFTDDGQNWGNPLYDWARLASTRFAWWIGRLRNGLRFADALRLDHFRGFAAFWSIPPDKEAIDGEWVPGPGAALFDAARTALGELPLIAEDLGVITPEVRRLRRQLGLPGTRVLQFAFSDPKSEHLPHNLDPDVYLYTGTHDNPPIVTWLENLDEEDRDRVLEYSGGTVDDAHWSLIRTALASVADTAVLPMQDLLGLDERATMNRPSIPTGNWEWRLESLPDAPVAARLERLVRLTGRLPDVDATPPL